MSDKSRGGILVCALVLGFPMVMACGSDASGGSVGSDSEVADVQVGDTAPVDPAETSIGVDTGPLDDTSPDPTDAPDPPDTPDRTDTSDTRPTDTNTDTASEVEADTAPDPEVDAGCIDDEACDDGEVCTTDRCESDGRCSRTPADGLSCVVDENACTTGDVCRDGACEQGPPAVLDDGNPCTADLCVKGEVTHRGLSEGQCDDGNNCTTDDRCVLGTCVGGPLVECVRPICASSSSCVPGVGCVPVWSPVDAVCDDNDPCTTLDRCHADHTCAGSDAWVDDGDPCTADACDPRTGEVTHTPLDIPECDDEPCVDPPVCIGEVCSDPSFTCVTITRGTLAFEALPALGADGLVHTAGRTVPTDYTAPQNDLRRVGRTYVLRSSDLGIAWGPVPNHANCAFNSGSPIPALDERGWVFTQGDWNDGASDFCASIFAKNQADGTPLWNTQPGGPHPRHLIGLTPTHAVYGGNSGSVRAFDLTTGAITATMNLAVGYSEGGSIVIASNGDAIISQNNHKMERWTLAGSRVWTSTVLRHELHMTLGDHVVGFTSNNSQLTVADGQTGALRWSQPVSTGSGAILSDAGGNLYFGHDGGARSLDAAGQPRWSTALVGVAQAQLLGDDGRFYVRTPSTLYALDMADGTIVWRLDAAPGNITIDGATVPNRFSGTFSLLAGGNLFATDYAGNLYRLDTAIAYASSPWPRPRGNRLNSGRVDHQVPMP
jgi:outer membrane protein assembly factor BamB